MKKIQKVCAECGSEDIRLDAYADWNFEKQDFGVIVVFDSGHFCEACEDECSIKDVEVEVPDDEEYADYFNLPLDEYLKARFKKCEEAEVFKIISFDLAAKTFIEALWIKQWYEYQTSKLKGEK